MEPELELEITDVAHGGVFVARHEGQVIFVPDVLPGERVAVRITDSSHERFLRAEVVEVLSPSPDRREHIWRAAGILNKPEGRAGGAEFGHIRSPYQRELKARVLRDALQRMAGISVNIEVEGVELDRYPDGLGWRTRVRLHADEDGVLGPYAKRSHRVIPVSELPLATARVAAAAPLGQTFPGAAHVDVLAPTVGEAQLRVTPRSGRRPRGAAVQERVGDRIFRVEHDGFWQVHERAAETLSQVVAAVVDGSRFDPGAGNLDLYGGVGVFAAALADRFGTGVRVTSVESDARATGHARSNLADLPNFAAVTSRVDRFLKAQQRSRRNGEATVVLDPPRSGAGREVIERLSALVPEQIVYVACDPVAFARDAGLLERSGYQLTQLRAFDLFPNTHHVEVVGHFIPHTRPRG